MRIRVALGCLLLVNCGPKAEADDVGEGSSGAASTGSVTGGSGVTGGLDETGMGDGGTAAGEATEDPSSGPSSDPSGPSSDTEWPDDSEGPAESFACADPTWLAMMPAKGDVKWAMVDGRGHVRVADHRSVVREVDATGAVVGSVVVAAENDHVIAGGADAAHAWYVGVHAGEPEVRSVRKFDANGAQVWEAPLGDWGGPDAWIWGLAVAPDGSSVASVRTEQSDQTRLVKHDAAGAAILDKVVSKPTSVVALDAEGRMGAYGYDGGGEVRGLSADGTTLWKHDRWVADGAWGAWTGDGAFVVGAPNSDEIAAARYEAGGAVAWDKQFEPTPDSIDGVYHFAANAAGESVVALKGQPDGVEGVIAVKLDANGEVVATHGCGPALWGRDVKTAIDAAGAVYLIGSAWSGDTAIHFVAKYE